MSTRARSKSWFAPSFEERVATWKKEHPDPHEYRCLVVFIGATPEAIKARQKAWTDLLS